MHDSKVEKIQCLQFVVKSENFQSLSVRPRLSCGEEYKVQGKSVAGEQKTSCTSVFFGSMSSFQHGDDDVDEGDGDEIKKARKSATRFR